MGTSIFVLVHVRYTPILVLDRVLVNDNPKFLLGFVALHKPKGFFLADFSNKTQKTTLLEQKCRLQPVEKLVFDRLAEVTKAVKTSNSHSSAYRWYGRVGVVQ